MKGFNFLNVLLCALLVVWFVLLIAVVIQLRGLRL
jgi:hypothetical protein